MITVTLIKENHLIGVAYIFRGLVYYCHGGTWQHTDRRVLEKELRVLHLDLQATRSSLSVTLSKA